MKGGFFLSVTAVLGGVWVGISPFLVGFPPKHGPWTAAVTTSVWIGAAIVFAGLVGLIAFAAGSLGHLNRVRQARSQGAVAIDVPAEREPVSDSGEAAPKLDAVEDPDEALRTLVDRVLQDHSLAFDKPSR